MPETKDIVRDIFITLIFVIYGFLVLFQLPQLFLFAGRGIEQETNLWKFTIYTSMGTFALLFLILFKWARYIFKNMSELSWVNSVLHDPEESIFGKLPISKTILNNIMLTILASIIIFLPIAIGGNLQRENTFYPNTILPHLEQQVTETAELGLSAYPASPAETLSLAVTVSLLIMLFGFLKTSGVIDNLTENVMVYTIVPVVGTLLWVSYHLARYGTSDVAIIAVGLFGLISSLLIVVFRSVIPALLYHDINNIVKKAFFLFSNDALLFVLGGLEILAIIMFLYLFVNNFMDNSNEIKVI